LVNLGANRWSFRPELGLSKAVGPLTLEAVTSAVLFTNNTNFLAGQTRSQAPIVVVQSNIIYDFGGGIWGAVGAQYLIGGTSTVAGQGNQDMQRNWRVGGTVSVPFGPNYSVKMLVSSGVSARTGNNYDLIGLFVQYRWGAGL
jgi:hypothetical protein